MSKFNRSATVHLFLLFSILLFTLSSGFVLQELPLYREERNMKQLQEFLNTAKRGLGSGRIHPFASIFYTPRNYPRKFSSNNDSDEVD